MRTHGSGVASTARINRFAGAVTAVAVITISVAGFTIRVGDRRAPATAVAMGDRPIPPDFIRTTSTIRSEVIRAVSPVRRIRASQLRCHPVGRNVCSVWFKHRRIHAKKGDPRLQIGIQRQNLRVTSVPDGWSSEPLSKPFPFQMTWMETVTRSPSGQTRGGNRLQ